MASESIKDRACTNIYRGLGQQLHDEDLCDLIVVVGEKEFSCHGVVLASVSEFFRASLKPCWREDSSRKVDITHEDVSPESFGYLLDILYRGKDVINSKTAKDILRMSVYLQIKFLEEYCVEFLQKSLQPTVCLETWHFAQRYDLDTLAEKAFKMAVDHICNVWQQDELLSLPKSMLLILLSLQQKLSMDDICKTILRWVEADQEKREVHLLELLPFVSFPLLSSDYLCELLDYLNHPFKEAMFENIREGLTFHLSNDATKKQRILARQPVYLCLNQIQTRIVMVGGYTKVDIPTTDNYVFDIQQSVMKLYRLQPLPKNVGLDFASCTWYNEVYVSGGSQLSEFFSVYKPGDNKWEVLPSLPDGGREKHAMAAVSTNIYVLGGLVKSSTGEKTTSSSVCRYNTRSKEWKIFCHLTSGVQEAAAAALGHRIYLFGGVSTTGEISDVVQCVDTMSGCTYQAGKLPSPTHGARALSNRGRIYVVTPKGELLSMWESFLLAENIEKKLSERKAKKESEDHSSEMARSTVSFKKVGNCTGRRDYSTCLHGGNIYVCGGVARDGQLLQTIEQIRLDDGAMLKTYLTLTAGAAKFDLHVLNVPMEFMKEDHLNQQSSMA
ncbi:hypothetical protein C0Q70_12506 [Pomacea canaliculata]|uniref:BTB domain-containing protein n=1 Tax=Pomacea canaliculata TaxID=400727 RepID=A0A2T7P1R9_POMCA|nr:hypothetical protein C0Q70_12506 [Pomacea canaliculata]